MTAALEAAALRLGTAARTRTPCAPVRDLIGTDIALAYAVQAVGVDARTAAGARVVGYKIGLTSPAVQRQLGVDQPDSGVLLDEMQARGPVPCRSLLQPKAEAEVAFVLGAEPDPDDVASSVDFMCAAIEIVDSRITEWDITITDTIADNASSGMFVLGDERLALTEVSPVEVEMTMMLNGRPASTGNGRSCLGDPLIALAWLARMRAEAGDGLRKGDIVLSGALGPMTAVSSGDTVEADLGRLGTLRAQFE